MSAHMEEIQSNLTNLDANLPGRMYQNFTITLLTNDNPNMSSVIEGNSNKSLTERQCHMYDFLMEAIFMGILCLLGFGGNTLSMICLSKDRSKTATPFLLVSLEAADTFFLLTVLILRVLTSLDPYRGTPEVILGIAPYLAKFVFFWDKIINNS